MPGGDGRPRRLCTHTHRKVDRRCRRTCWAVSAWTEPRGRGSLEAPTGGKLCPSPSPGQSKQDLTLREKSRQVPEPPFHQTAPLLWRNLGRVGADGLEGGQMWRVERSRRRGRNKLSECTEGGTSDVLGRGATPGRLVKGHPGLPSLRRLKRKMEAGRVCDPNT